MEGRLEVEGVRPPPRGYQRQMVTSVLALLLLATSAFAADSQGGGMPPWAGYLIGAVILPFVWPWIKKAVAASIAKDFLKAVKAALAEGDEDDDVLILAFVHWVKVKSAKLDTRGADAYAVVSKWICSRVKILAGREVLVGELVETCVESVRDTATEIEKDAPVLSLVKTRESIVKIQSLIEAGGANENLTAATVLCSELLAAIPPAPSPPPLAP